MLSINAENLTTFNGKLCTKANDDTFCFRPINNILGFLTKGRCEMKSNQIQRMSENPSFRFAVFFINEFARHAQCVSIGNLWWRNCTDSKVSRQSYIRMSLSYSNFILLWRFIHTILFRCVFLLLFSTSFNYYSK